MPCAGCWTQWFDRDNPSGRGDYETLGHLRREYPERICPKPFDIEVQTTSGMSMASTGDVIVIADTSRGFICQNSDQKRGRCSDYRVRFRCPIDFCSPPGCWTQWFDRDNPSGSGDYETLGSLRREYPDAICPKPYEIEVQTTSGMSMASTGDVITVADTTRGFICRNSAQRHGRCSDYRVRFRCPLDFCNPPACWTPWFDRDNPSGHGDYETLCHLRREYPGQICPNPFDIEVQTTSGMSMTSTGNIITLADTITGFICKNSVQRYGSCEDYRVRFQCPLEFCSPMDCWTPWFDRDNPSGTGDFEILSRLRKENPNKICQTPSDIEVQTTSGMSMASTGDVIEVADPITGFICRNSSQKKRVSCSDYRVRFKCPFEFCYPRDMAPPTPFPITRIPIEMKNITEQYAPDTSETTPSN
ncbi:uncharacterized protein LOC129191490 [Dunckerocampus dactyliophorus]|uniref:uncharacterized protein LOC129191490 n=1 Tax=Dunckerocampus dactyliophorus TaxID=161453 RepID=UPI002406878D|nr:uncharacterized protein LOC129191490 [Dunckerocampus dactyliophorus]